MKKRNISEIYEKITTIVRSITRFPRFLLRMPAGYLGAAMILAMLISAMSGTLIPLFFRRIGVDPAVASGPLITTVNDLVAVVPYYGLSWLILLQWMQLG